MIQTERTVRSTHSHQGTALLKHRKGAHTQYGLLDKAYKLPQQLHRPYKTYCRLSPLCSRSHQPGFLFPSELHTGDITLDAWCEEASRPTPRPHRERKAQRHVCVTYHKTMETTVISWGVHTQSSSGNTVQIMEKMAIFALCCAATRSVWAGEGGLGGLRPCTR